MTVTAELRTAIAVRNLGFSYGSGAGVSGNRATAWSIRDLSFELSAGTVLGVLGPNGSGKTSLLKLLVKVLAPAAGSIELFGEPLVALSQPSVARTVALVPQDTLQLFPFTIAELILMGRFPHHPPAWRFGAIDWETREEWELTERVMAELNIAHLADRRLHEVSGGERQRALIARALVQEPQVLLLDEPTAFLDLHHQLEMLTLLRRLSLERGLTVVMVSHDLNLAAQACDRLLLLQGGRAVAIGTPEEVICPDVIRQVYGCEVLIDRHPVNGRPRVTL